MTSIKLTAKETALMTAVADRFFSFFDEGIVEGGGIWANTMNEEILGSRYNVSATQRGAASVLNSLVRKGLFASDGGDTEDGAWVYLTAAGEAWITEFNTVPGAPVVTPIEAPAATIEEEAAAILAAPTAVPAFAKGDVVNSKDGNQYVVRRVNANGTIRIVAADGSKFNRKAETLTKA